ncbi:MAG: hypothetical protein GTN86_01930, partial [Xanthomonadales bacterium]|nr:hypothetical protein [Xanthomonadales bacterium]NIN58775.1 hypothetical protein [Xanthomonadales bacterium]NIN74043.1 hypothetical protein [Xanthomonadales bacterium]NIO13793.1 hypothetical protein [Xanthomonadales bacterium]NIP11168.1 hypothetical protein [Xanthomonadales bacterium]
MSSKTRITSLLLTALLPLGCVSTPDQAPGRGAPETVFEGVEGIYVPDRMAAQSGPAIVTPDSATYMAEGPFPVAMSEAAAMPAPRGLGNLTRRSNGKRMEAPLPDEVMDMLREDARRLPPSPFAQAVLEGPDALGPTSASAQFAGPDYTQCCGGGGNVPPDPELAVGPNHIIAVVNVVFSIYDKAGNLVSGPTTFASFFAGMGSCTDAFDPNVLYDEEADRFVMGVDGNGTDYCVAATQSSNPTGNWYRYKFAANVNNSFFDYPHAGVGDDAIYMGANLFGAMFFNEGRVWAMDKAAMYSGAPMTVVTRSTGGESTPQPMNLHGFVQGTWPAGGPHYILTDGPFNGSTYGVWTWADPFGANTLVDTGTFDLDNFTGVDAGSPLDAPQSGTSARLQGNDWRVQDAEYRNGSIWMAHTIACNPGSGSVNCVRWAQIDPSSRTIEDAGVYATDGEYRMFADLAADDCDNMVMGYTKTSTSMFPAVFVAGREATDPPGMLQTEVEAKAGELTYTAFDGSPHRWGDYTGMTVDPDGSTFWYLGEYSKNTGTTSGRWGTWIASFTFDCNGEPSTDPPGLASNPSPADGATGVDLAVVLSWSAGSGAASHDVYFGTSEPPAWQGNQTGTSFDPGGAADLDA